MHKPEGALRDAIEGTVHLPGDAGYDAARLPWQRAVEQHPAMVVEAAGPADVPAAIRLARENGLSFAVQNTGHGAVRPCDGGLLLGTSSMTGVQVDPERHIARVGAGALWSDVITAAALYGLAPLSGSSAGVGVVGYTLGGGAGWLSRKYGFAADSVLSAEVVTAGGERLSVGPDEHPDLFWALRGGSGNFAVVTALEFRLYPVTRVYGGMTMYRVGRAAQALELYRDWALTEPDESNTALMLVRMPADPHLPEAVRGRPVLALRTFYAGGAEEAERVLAPLRAAAGPPLMDGAQAMAYADATDMISGPPPAPTAAVNRFDLFDDIVDEVVDFSLDALDGRHGPVGGIEFRHWGGAMARPAAGAGPVGHRHVPFSVNVGAMGTDSSAVDATAARLAPHATGGSFVNFLGDPACTATAYTSADHLRLARVKAAYDPDNLFSANHNIAPCP